MATVNPKLLTIELCGGGFEILPEHKRTKVAREVVRGKLERIHNAGKNRRALTLMASAMPLNIGWRCEDRSEDLNITGQILFEVLLQFSLFYYLVHTAPIGHVNDVCDLIRLHDLTELRFVFKHR